MTPLRTTERQYRGKPVERRRRPRIDREIQQRVSLCSRFATCMHAAGASAAKLESTLERLSTGLGVPGQFFVTPTALLASYSLPNRDRPHVRLLRVQPASIDVTRLADTESLAMEAARGTISPKGAEARLADLFRETSPNPWRWRGAAVAVSASAAILLGGGLAEAGLAGAVGLMIGTLESLPKRSDAIRRLVPAAVAALTAFLSLMIEARVPSFSVGIAQFASVILLVPGFGFTLAIQEIATAHLISGGARLMGAVGEFLLLGFGIAAGTSVASLVSEAGPPAPGSGTAWWILVGAVVLSALGFCGRFHARRSDMGMAILAGGLGFFAAKLATSVGGALGPFVGACSIGLAANLFARRTGRSALVMMAPALIPLVPGSFGFRSFSLLLGHDVLPAVEAVFQMLLVGTSLSVGLLVANLLVPTERGSARPRKDIAGWKEVFDGPD